MRRLKAGLERFLHERVYRHHRVLRMTANGKRILQALFAEYVAHPELLPEKHLRRWTGADARDRPAAAGWVTAARTPARLPGAGRRRLPGRHDRPVRPTGIPPAVLARRRNCRIDRSCSYARPSRLRPDGRLVSTRPHPGVRSCSCGSSAARTSPCSSGIAVVRVATVFVEQARTRTAVRRRRSASWPSARLVLFTDLREKQKQITTISAVYFGLLLGLLLGWLFSLALDPLLEVRASRTEPQMVAASGRVLITVVCCYVTISTLLQTKDEFRFIIPYVEFSKQVKGGRPLVLDTSVIIDGRIADVCDTRLIDTKLIVPRFVLQELQAIADSSDKLKRNRGRRGLDILKRLQTNPKIELQMHDGNVAGAADRARRSGWTSGW